jgi:hypothetical protein|tara:strand:- start:1 stop:240 length:240 start_codon:yes stop_codon:yes gene_type:complete
MVIDIDDTGISHGVLAIADQLPNPSNIKVGEEVTLKFRGDEFVFLTGLVLLASWRKSLPPGTVVKVRGGPEKSDTWISG